MVWYKITIAWKSLVTIFSRERCRSGAPGGGRERTETTRGKGSGKKVERENRECTCNLTVMKGTPRKECNTTTESVGWGLKKEEKKRKLLNFQHTAWEHGVFLTVRRASWNEKAKQSCLPNYLVNHQHYKPVQQAWRRKHRKRKTEKDLNRKLNQVPYQSCFSSSPLSLFKNLSSKLAF